MSSTNDSNTDQINEDVQNTTPTPETEETSSNTTDASVEKKEDYPEYTEENPMKLPVETGDQFVIGLDFGNTTSVVAVGKYGELSHQPHVLHNSLGDLTHTALVSYGESRILGTDAMPLLVRSPNETIYDIKYLNNHKLSEDDKKSYPFEIITDNESFASGVTLNADVLGDKKEILYPEIMGGLISKFCSYAEKDSLYWQFREKILRQRVPKNVPVENRDVHGVPVNDCIIAIPSCYTAKQRASILDAGKIAGVEIKGFIDEGIASALTYALSKRHEFKESKKQNSSSDEGETYPETVAIIDIGHCYFNISISKIGYNRIKILHSSSVEIGGNNFQQNLCNFITKKLKEKFSISHDLSDRTKARVIRAVEKSMKVLSTVNQSHVEIENFHDGRDVRETVSRSEFDSLCSDLLSQISSHIKSAFDSVSEELKDGNECKVEIVGGGSRIPAVQSIIQQATSTSQLRFTLDSNNSVAMGAAIYGSIVSFNGAYDLEDQSFEFINNTSSADADSEIEKYRLSSDDLQNAILFENKLKKHAEDIRKFQELRNNMEQAIYRHIDDISSFRDQIPPEEATALDSLVEKEKEWLLYDEESSSCSFDDLSKHNDEFNESIKTTAPSFQKLLEQRELDRIKAEKEAAEAEKNRTTTVRDKIKNPKTPRERVDAAIARKDQGNSFFK